MARHITLNPAESERLAHALVDLANHHGRHQRITDARCDVTHESATITYEITTDVDPELMTRTINDLHLQPGQ